MIFAPQALTLGTLKHLVIQQHMAVKCLAFFSYCVRALSCRVDRALPHSAYSIAGRQKKVTGSAVGGQEENAVGALSRCQSQQFCFAFVLGGAREAFLGQVPFL